MDYGLCMPLKKPSILVIDDEAEIVDQVKEYFEEEGFEVMTAETGMEGIQILRKCQPQVIILDMKLPDMSGLSILKVIKENCLKSKVITMTGYVDQAMMDQAEELGRDTFLQKPFDLERLKQEVDKLIRS